MSAVIDRVNILEMSKASSVQHYSRRDDLCQAEQAALRRVAEAAQGRRILDIGVGGGRTVRALREVSSDYLGIDYSQEMIAACQRRYPGVAFRHGDARSMTYVPDGSVHLAMFSCNGIGMVAHADRLRIFREVQRVLEPGGVFLFSTHNQESPDHSAGLKLPELQLSLNPARSLVRVARFARSTVLRMQRRRQLQQFEVRNSEYSMINDACHDYGVMLYYISLARQRQQLEKLGFCADAEAFDLNGKRIVQGTRDSSIMMIARKPG